MFLSKIPAPNFTQIPNVVFDEWLPQLGLVELRVLMVLMRKTFGWHKLRDRISLSQLMQATGSNRTRVSEAVQSLQKKGIINKIVTGRCGEQSTFYELIIEDSNNSCQYHRDTPPSIKSVPTKETLTKEKKRKMNKEKEPCVSPPPNPRSKREGLQPPLDPPPLVSSKRKKVKEPKIQLADRVHLTESQKKSLEEKFGQEKVLKAVEAVNEWKLGKGIEGGNDYATMLKWGIKAAEERIAEEQSPAAQNLKFCEDLKLEFPEPTRGMQIKRGYVQLPGGKDLSFNMNHVAFKRTLITLLGGTYDDEE